MLLLAIAATCGKVHCYAYLFYFLFFFFFLDDLVKLKRQGLALRKIMQEKIIRIL